MIRGWMLAATTALMLALAAAGCSKPIEYKTSTSLPADFPKDIPLYPKAELVTVVTGGGTIVVSKTTDSLAAVQELLTKEFRGKGWQVSTIDGLPAAWMGDRGLVLVAAGQGHKVSLAIGERGRETIITTIVHQG